jgi:ketosteroid isomerase-like protein
MVDATDPNVEVLRTYFESLDAADFERAADQFTESVSYRHPPMYGDETHVDGRDALLEFFVDVRGVQESRHVLERTVSNGDSAAAVGYVTDPDEDEPYEYFVSFAEFENGRIDYYIGGLLGMA